MGAYTDSANFNDCKAKYQLLLDTAPDAVFVVDRDGRIADCNQNVTATYGFQPSAVVGQRLEELLPIMPPQAGGKRNDAAADFQPFERELKIVRNGGDVIDIRRKSIPLNGPGETPLGMLIYDRDISIFKRSVSEIEQQKKFLENILESLTHPFVIIDTSDYSITMANSFFPFKKTDQSGYGHKCHQVIHGLDAPCHLSGIDCPVRRVKMTGQPLMVEHEHVNQDGEYRNIEVHGFPVFSKNGDVSMVMKYHVDITERKMLESMAEASNLMNNIGFIFSGIRHELGNPINSLKMSLTVLDQLFDTYDREQIREFVQRSLSELARVEYLLTAFRNFSMFEKPKCTPIDLREFFESFLALAGCDLESRGINLLFFPLSGPDYTGIADPRALQQVMLNLVKNAADALESSHNPEITIKLSHFRERIQIEVIDNGPGINENNEKNLFRPFFTTKPNGTGLGLVIVKKLLSDMNAFITIDSRSKKEIGKTGTRVVISIPRGER